MNARSNDSGIVSVPRSLEPSRSRGNIARVLARFAVMMICRGTFEVAVQEHHDRIASTQLLLVVGETDAKREIVEMRWGPGDSKATCLRISRQRLSEHFELVVDGFAGGHCWA